MSGDVHAGFCERRGVRFPPATHHPQPVLVRGVEDQFDTEDRPVRPELDQAFEVLWQQFESY